MNKESLKNGMMDDFLNPFLGENFEKNSSLTLEDGELKRLKGAISIAIVSLEEEKEKATVDEEILKMDIAIKEYYNLLEKMNSV